MSYILSVFLYLKPKYFYFFGKISNIAALFTQG